MKHARPACQTIHRAARRAQGTPEQSIPQNPGERTAKSQSIEILTGEDERVIFELLALLPAECVRKVRIYAQVLTDMFYGR